MTIIDDFKSEQNRNIIFQASNKMLLDKYKLSLNNVVLTNIINAIISSMSKEAILMNNTIKLMELNTITLAKMKDYVIKNIDNINAANAANAANADNSKVLNEVAVVNATNPVDSSSIEADDYKTEVLTNEDLLIRVKEYENKRNISNAVLANIANNNDIPPPPDANAANTATNMNIIPDIIEKVFASMNTNTSSTFNKKTLIIHSNSRDWINCPRRNKLSFTINIDLQNNIIEPLKILFPKYVKDITPYIILVITDNHKTFKYHFLYSKSSGKWDIWKLINKDNNINNNINLANKNWKISILDYLNNELNLGTDDIKVSQINDYDMNNTYDKYDNNISIDTNIDNILMPRDDTKEVASSFYEINIDYSNILEYDEYNLNTISKYDYMQLKTYGGKYVNVKVIDVNINFGKIIISNENNLAKEDFINSSLLNYGAQYSLILTYYPKSNP